MKIELHASAVEEEDEEDQIYNAINKFSELEIIWGKTQNNYKQAQQDLERLRNESQERLNQLYGQGQLQTMVKKYEGNLDIGHQFQLAHPGSRPDNETLQ